MRIYLQLMAVLFFFESLNLNSLCVIFHNNTSDRYMQMNLKRWGIICIFPGRKRIYKIEEVGKVNENFVIEFSKYYKEQVSDSIESVLKTEKTFNIKLEPKIYMLEVKEDSPILVIRDPEALSSSVQSESKEEKK